MQVVDARPHELLVRARSLRSRGRVHVTACASIAVQNGKYAELFLGERQYYWRIVDISRRRQEYRVSSAEAGTRLQCKPCTAGDIVTLWLRLENDFFVGTTLPPAIRQRRVTTTLRVCPDDTVLIGGLKISESTVELQRPWPHHDPFRIGVLATGRFKVKVARRLFVLLELRARRGSVPPRWGGESLALSSS